MFVLYISGPGLTFSAVVWLCLESYSITLIPPHHTTPRSTFNIRAGDLCTVQIVSTYNNNPLLSQLSKYSANVLRSEN